MVRKEIINNIKKYLFLLNKEGIHVDKAYLYGSYAKETESAESDIDLMIISTGFDNNNDKIK